MDTNRPFLKDDTVFEPTDIRAMSNALDDICKALNITNGATAARKVIAERIIELALRGERSRLVLRERVLKESGLELG